MKLHKLEVYVLNFENSSLEDIVVSLENNKYHSIQVKQVETAEIGDWSDDHVLNKINTPISKFRDYFKSASDLVFRLTERARIRRQIQTRKSVQEGKPDRISDLLEEAAMALEELQILK